MAIDGAKQVVIRAYINKIREIRDEYSRYFSSPNANPDTAKKWRRAFNGLCSVLQELNKYPQGRVVVLTDDDPGFEDTVECLHRSDVHTIICPYVEQPRLDHWDGRMAIVLYL